MNPLRQKFSDADAMYMRRALELARQGAGLVSPNPMVGAVLVRDGKIIGEGFHRQAGTPHAEANAINNAAGSVAGATMYVTLEPCNHFGRTPPCAPLLVEEKVARVVVPHADPNPTVAGEGFKVLRRARIQVDVGLMEHEARRLNEAFLTYHQLKRPFVVAKWAMTLDGQIASMTGESRWISNEKSRTYVHELRSNVDAVMVGIGTVLQDNPILNVRLKNYRKRQPRRIIVDGNLRIPMRSLVLENAPPGECIIATSEVAPPDKIAKLREAGHTIIVLKGRRGLVNVKQLISELHRFQIQSILCEGGSRMHGSLMESGTVDKVVAFIAPKIVGSGDDPRSPILGWGLPSMNKSLQLHDLTIHQFDGDVCIEGYLADQHTVKAERTGAARQRAAATGNL